MSAPPNHMTCPSCAGYGKIRDLMHEVSDPCPLCNSTGKVPPSKAFDNIGDSNTLIFHFPSKNAAIHFKTYMCDGGGEHAFLEPQNFLIEQGDLDPKDKIEEFVYHTGDNTIIVR